MGAKGVDKHKAIMAKSRIAIVWNLTTGLGVYNINLLSLVYEWFQIEQIF